jgi:hypothetical protein
VTAVRMAVAVLSALGTFLTSQYDASRPTPA